jgi:hypothetical protein
MGPMEKMPNDGKECNFELLPRFNRNHQLPYTAFENLRHPEMAYSRLPTCALPAPYAAFFYSSRSGTAVPSIGLRETIHNHAFPLSLVVRATVYPHL